MPLEPCQFLQFWLHTHDDMLWQYTRNKIPKAPLSIVTLLAVWCGYLDDLKINLLLATITNLIFNIASNAFKQLIISAKLMKIAHPRAYTVTSTMFFIHPLALIMLCHQWVPFTITTIYNLLLQTAKGHSLFKNKGKVKRLKVKVSTSKLVIFFF